MRFSTLKQEFDSPRGYFCGISTVAVRLLPKQETRVQFSYPAFAGIAPTRFTVGVPHPRRYSRGVGTQYILYMTYVYILESTKDGRYYIGSTKNLDDRLRHHKSGLTYSTKRFGGVKLVFRQKFPSLKEARYIEKKLKNLKRKDYLKKIIEDGYIKLKLA